MEEFLAACKSGDTESVSAHLAVIKDEKSLQKGLFAAVKAQEVPTIAFLLQHGVPIDYMSFLWASRASSEEIWACFILHGFDINSIQHGSSALYLSTENPSLVQWLLEHGADPNLSFTMPRGSSRKTRAIKSAIAVDSLDSMRILIAHGAVLDSDLFDEILDLPPDDELGVEMLQLLLDAGLDPNVMVGAGRGTPLQLAVRRGMLDKARALLKAGASTTILNEHGEPPLAEAQTAGNKEMVDLLTNFSK